MHSNVIIKQKVNAPVDKVWDAITVKDQLKESRMSLKDIQDTVNYLLREKRLSPEEVEFVSEAVDKFKTPIKMRPIVGITTPMITSDGEEIDLTPKEFELFLFPVIDSTNLNNLFTESKFLDQTINAFTFTYVKLTFG